MCVEVSIGCSTTLVPFQVVPRLPSPVLLGVDFATKVKMVLDFSTGCFSTGGANSQSIKFPLIGVQEMDQDVGEYDPEVECHPSEMTSPRACALSQAEKTELDDIFQEFQEVFDVVPGLTAVACHSIDVGESKPVRSYPYRVSEDRKAALNEELDKLHVKTWGRLNPLLLRGRPQ